MSKDKKDVNPFEMATKIKAELKAFKEVVNDSWAATEKDKTLINTIDSQFTELVDMNLGQSVGEDLVDPMDEDTGPVTFETGTNKNMDVL